MKQTKFLFKFLALLIILVYSCREELLNENISPAQRNKSDFFKRTTNTQKTAARIGIDYISILEEYNEKTNFISSIEDQKGLPNWEKMQVLKRNKEITLYIPLSYNNTSLSSLILVNIDDRKNVYALKNFTNNFLKNYVYNNNYPADKRKFLMDTFMAMDYMTFGNQQFTNLPLDLYKGVGEYNSLNVLNTTIENDISSKFIYETTCLTLHSCVNGCSLASCDYANCQHGGKCSVLKFCTTTTTWEDTGGYDPQHGSDNGGMSGGGGTPGPQPPKDPCTTQDDGGVFYRLIPGCAPNNEENEDPCEKIKTNNTEAKDLFNDLVIKKKDSTMRVGISTSTIEKAFTFGKNSTGTYVTSDIISGPSSGASVDMPATHTAFTVEGGIHNHSTITYDVPSPGDIYWFHTVHTTNSHFNYYGTNGANTGSVYVFTITNSGDFANFKTNFPASTYFDLSTQNWKETESIGADFKNAFDYFVDKLNKTDEESNELSMAYVIGKYGMGIGISKKDSSGNFQPIFVKENNVYAPTGNPLFPLISIKTYEVTTDCNLK